MNTGNNHYFNNFFVLTLAFTTFLLGFFLGNYQGFQRGINQDKQESSAKIAELNKTLDFFIPPLPDEIFSVTGKITAIETNIISLEIISLDERWQFGVAPKMETRKITVAKDAKITKFNPLAFPEIDKKTGEIKPLKQEAIKLSDLKVGDQITASAKENIKTKTEFEVVEIQLQILPELPTPPTLPALP